jgi:hypothetical protein
MEKDNHRLVLENYKLKHTDTSLPKEFLINEDDEKRRRLKFLYNSYNYIPLLCQSNCGREECIYAHTENEINYHPLIYKTEFGKIKNDSDSFNYRSNGSRDFRIIYNNDAENARSLCVKLEKWLTNKKLHMNYMDVIEPPTEFNLDNYKVLGCTGCGRDYHYCYRYHEKKLEQRRPQTLFYIRPESCKDAFIDELNKFIKERCLMVVLFNIGRLL